MKNGTRYALLRSEIASLASRIGSRAWLNKGPPPYVRTKLISPMGWGAAGAT